MIKKRPPTFSTDDRFESSVSVILQDSSSVFTRTELIESFIIVRVKVPELYKTYSNCYEVSSFLVKTHTKHSARNFVSRYLFPGLKE